MSVLELLLFYFIFLGTTVLLHSRYSTHKTPYYHFQKILFYLFGQFLRSSDEKKKSTHFVLCKWFSLLPKSFLNETETNVTTFSTHNFF